MYKIDKVLNRIEPLAEKKICRISYKMAMDGYDEQNREQIFNWFKKYIPRFEAAFKGSLAEVNKQLKAKSSQVVMEGGV